MSKHGAAPKSGPSASTTPAWLPSDEDDSYTVPLNLQKELARVSLGADDRVVIENMPQGAALTIGEQKPDGSWMLLPNQIAVVEYIPLTHNGQTYYLQLNVLTTDPTALGLLKTKARLKIAVKVPEAKLPPLDAYPLPQPAALPPPAQSSDTVIHLPAGPHIKSDPAPTPEALALPAPQAEPETVKASEPQPEAAATVEAIAAPVAAAPAATLSQVAPPAVADAAQDPEPVTAPRPTLDLDKHFNAHTVQWKSLLGDELKAAERRLEAAQTELLARMRAVLLRDDDARATAVESALKADFAGRAATAAPLAMQAEVEARMNAMYETRLAESEAAWKDEITRRIESAHAEWSKAEAERMAAAENRWRAEHEQRLESVLENFGLLVRNQLGGTSDSEPPAPEIRPTEMAAAAA